MTRYHLFWVALLLARVFGAHSAEFTVAVEGAAGNDGSPEHPFATLAQARDAIRALKGTGAGDEPVTVTLRGGLYAAGSFVLTASDAGTTQSPITYRAAPGAAVVLDAGRTVDKAEWRPLPAAARARLHPGVDPSRLVALDLRAAGYSHLGPWGDLVLKNDIADLFVNGRRMPLARWPNPDQRVGTSAELPGWTTMNGSAGLTSFFVGAGGRPQDGDATNEVNADGSGRLARWRAALDAGRKIWLKGFWRVPWTARTVRISEINMTSQTIALAANADGGMGSKYSPNADPLGTWRLGSGKEMWQAINLLEEIDTPGEYAVDFQEGMLYFYPPAPLESCRCVIADQAEPLIDVKPGAANLHFIGLTLQHGLGHGIRIVDAPGILIAGCTIRNVDFNGIDASGPGTARLDLRSNNIDQTGAAGIKLTRLGNRATLAPAQCTVFNNYVHHVGQVTFDEGISMQTLVGAQVAHNLIHDCPMRGLVYYSVNDCIFEKNEIHNVALQTSDMGAFYARGGWSTYGNLLRRNFMHHIVNANGIYFDDGDSGDTAEENVIYGAGYGFLAGGGHHNIIRRNLIVGAGKWAALIDDRGITRNYFVDTSYGQELRDLKVGEEPWKSYYAALAATLGYEGTLYGDVLNPAWHPEYPNGCRAEQNVAVACANGFRKPAGVSGEKVALSGNLAFKTLAEAGFENPEALNFMTGNPALLSLLPDPDLIVKEAGLVLDGYRKSLPADAETGRLRDHRGDPSVLPFPSAAGGAWKFYAHEPN